MMGITDMDTGPSYFTSYRVTHDALGKSRGDGAPHIREKPPRFNVITGNNLILTTRKIIKTEENGRSEGLLNNVV